MNHSYGKILVCAFVLVFLSASAGYSHFGMVIPSDNMVMKDDERSIDLELSFSHPFEGRGMELVKPERFFVVKDGKKESLLDSLESAEVMGEKAWQANYPVKRPGAYTFCMVPEPYWEPAEDCYIIHYTKTVAAAYGLDEGWDAEVGLKTEIVPLTKPYALYENNLFQGVVKLNGEPVPHAEVEVEYYDREGRFEAPSDYMVTQTVKADKNGVFSYAVPGSGWWGFAALSTSGETKVHKGEEKEIELGAVIWVRFEEWREKK
ncbi:MAG: DUF4198 domain-containing protein [Desulfobacteraceae bacterium]